MAACGPSGDPLDLHYTYAIADEQACVTEDGDPVEGCADIPMTCASAVMLRVVPNVDDHAQVAGRQGHLEPVRELRATSAAGQEGDLHGRERTAPLPATYKHRLCIGPQMRRYTSATCSRGALANS